MKRSAGSGLPDSLTIHARIFSKSRRLRGQSNDRRSLLESLLEPSRVINEQYQNTTVALKDGELLVGKLVKDGEDEIMLEPDAVSNPRERIARSKIDRVYPSPVSPMPEGLLDSFSQQDIADLIAYIESGGREGNAR